MSVSCFSLFKHVNKKLCSHLQRVEGVSVVERSWSGCLIEITLCCFCCSSHQMAMLMGWRFTVCHQSQSKSQISLHEGKGGDWLHEKRDEHQQNLHPRGSKILALKFWLLNFSRLLSLVLACSRLSPRRCLFTTPGFLSNWCILR